MYTTIILTYENLIKMKKKSHAKPGIISSNYDTFALNLFKIHFEFLIHDFKYGFIKVMHSI